MAILGVEERRENTIARVATLEVGLKFGQMTCKNTRERGLKGPMAPFHGATWRRMATQAQRNSRHTCIHRETRQLTGRTSLCASPGQAAANPRTKMQISPTHIMEECSDAAIWQLGSCTFPPETDLYLVSRAFLNPLFHAWETLPSPLSPLSIPYTPQLGALAHTNNPPRTAPPSQTTTGSLCRFLQYNLPRAFPSIKE